MRRTYVDKTGNFPGILDTVSGVLNLYQFFAPLRHCVEWILEASQGPLRIVGIVFPFDRKS